LKRIFILVVIIFTIISCQKRNEQNTGTENAISDVFFEDEVVIRKAIEDSNKLDIEVFIAISILYNNYVRSYMDQSIVMSEEDQIAFFTEKRKEFFTTIKYTESEYDDFMINNEQLFINYLSNNPELQKFFTYFK